MTDETLSQRSRTVFGALGAAVLIGGAAAVAIGTIPSHGGDTYYNASFGRAGQGLDGKSDVKIRGIAVGGVDSVRLARDGRVTVRIRVDKGVRIPTTTSARIEPVSIFGPKDLTLDLGSGEGQGPWLRDGGTITKTTDPQELSDIAWPAYRLTSAIDPNDVATLLHTFAQGLSGEGPALRRSIDNGTKLVDLAYDNRAYIRQLISDINALSGTVSSRGDTITGLAADFNRLSPAINDRPDKLAQLLDGASGVSTQAGYLLSRRGDDIGRLIDSSGKVVGTLYGQRANIPVLIDGLNGFFTLLPQIIRVPGPQGTQLAQVVNRLPVDLCKTFVDVCQPESTGTAFDQKVKK